MVSEWEMFPVDLAHCLHALPSVIFLPTLRQFVVISPYLESLESHLQFPEHLPLPWYHYCRVDLCGQNGRA